MEVKAERGRSDLGPSKVTEGLEGFVQALLTRLFCAPSEGTQTSERKQS